MQKPSKSRHNLTTACIISVAFTRALLAGQDHLVPIPPFDMGQQIVFDMLIPRKDWYIHLWMIGESGATTLTITDTPEYAVMIRSKPDYGESESDRIKHNPYVLELARLDHSITQHQISRGIGTLEFYKENFKVMRKECEIDESLFELVQRAWIRVTRGTRTSPFNEEIYPPVLMFYVNSLSGRTVMGGPVADFVSDLSKISQQLIKIVESKPEDRKSLIEECRTMAQKLVAAPPDEYEKFRDKDVHPI